MKTHLLRNGYSLVETLLTLSIMTSIAALAAPSMVEFLATMRLRSAADAMVNSLLLTRSEAVHRSARVVMCKSIAGNGCTFAGDWAAGWIVFQDHNNSGTQDPGEPTIYRQEPLAGGIRMTGNITVDQYVSYTPFGQAKLLNGGFQAGTFSICSMAGMTAVGYQVVVASTGRARVSKVTSMPCHLPSG